ncbi:hypothetical protein FHR59_002644 [Xanthomonas arboricola]|nr:hypothetical protein [Xanthomonas arboricola]
MLATDGFEQSELIEPKRLLESWGAKVDVIAPGDAAQIRAWNKTDWGDSVPVDQRLDQAKIDSYDALVLPGGVLNPDTLRGDAKAIAFIQALPVPTSRSPRSATARGCWWKAIWFATVTSPRGRRSRPICAMPARAGRMRRWLSTGR